MSVGIILVALLYTLSSISISFLRYDLHAGMQYSEWGLTIVLYSGIINSFFLYTIFRAIYQSVWLPFAAEIHTALIPSYQHLQLNLYPFLYSSIYCSITHCILCVLIPMFCVEALTHPKIKQYLPIIRPFGHLIKIIL